MTEQKIQALRTRGFRRAAVETGTGDILLSFNDDGGEERWLQLPLEAAGSLAAGLLVASREAAKRRSGKADPATERTLSEGMSMKDCELGVSLDGHCAILTIHTVSGLTFEFPLRPEAISDIRAGLRKAEAILNQSRRQGRDH
jgi:hypothetical protein